MLAISHFTPSARRSQHRNGHCVDRNGIRVLTTEWVNQRPARKWLDPTDKPTCPHCEGSDPDCDVCNGEWNPRPPFRWWQIEAEIDAMLPRPIYPFGRLEVWK